MSDQVTSPSTREKRPVFRGSLIRTVLVSLMIIALVPVLTIGTLIFIRTRNSLQTQAIGQLASLSNSYSTQIEQLALTRKNAFDAINKTSGFDSNIDIVLGGKTESAYYLALTSLINYFNQYIQTPTEKIFDQVALVDSAGTILVSSNRDSIGTNLSESNYIKTLYQTNQTVLSYNPGGLYPDQLVLITTKLYRSPVGAPSITLIGFSTPALPQALLNSIQTFFTSSRGLLLTNDQNLLSISPETGLPVVENLSAENRISYDKLINTSGVGKDFQYTNSKNIRVFSYIKKLPSVKSVLIVEVPRQVVLSQIQSLLPFTIIVLLVLMIISAVVVYFGSRRVVLPLVELANNAQTFAGGDWSFRAKVTRNDEIGQLAYSFNYMVDQLTGYYRSLEEKVDARTKLLRTASEIAQTASNASSQGEILNRASKQIIEKFDYPYNAFYIVDAPTNTATLVEQTSTIKGALPDINTRIPLNDQSLVGWTGDTKQLRLAEQIEDEISLTNKAGLVPNCKSELTIPILIDGNLFGVLDLQSDKDRSFDIEIIPVFTTLANQLATGLRNSQAVESAQVGLKETNALYSASRLVTIAQSVDEVNSQITTLFNQTSLVSIFLSVSNDQIQLINVTDPKGTRLDQSLKGFNIPFAKGLARLAEGGVIIIDNLNAQSDYSNLTVYFERRGCTSTALIPVFSGNQLSYILAIGSRETLPVNLLQIQPFANLAEVIGATLERINLVDTLNQRVLELLTLSGIGQSAISASDINDLFSKIHEQLVVALGSGFGFAAALTDSKNNRISIPYYFDTKFVSIEPYPYSDDLMSEVLTKGTPVLHRDASVLGLRTIDSDLQKITTKSWLGVPLTIAGRVLGGLFLFDSKTANRFSETELNLMNALTPQIASAVQNSELLTSQSEALRAYAQERFLLNSLLKNIPDEIVFKNPKGEFIRVSNSAALARQASSPDALVGKLDPDAMEFGFEEGTDQSVIQSGSPLEGKIEQVKSTGGVESWALTSKIPLLDETGKVEALLKISRDVSELVTTQNISKRRADQLLTTSEIAREATTGNLDISETLKRLVDLVKTRFGFYHSSIFLLDALKQNAVLRESTGEAGAVLKQKGHKLAVGSASIVGQATGRGEPVVVGDVTLEENYYPNPLLPNTRSELAIPLKIGDQVYGALDVQSEAVNAFSVEDISILRVLADQLTVTIQNANLYSKTQQTLERHRLLHQITSAAGQNITVEDVIRNAVQTLHMAMLNAKIAYLNPDGQGNLVSMAYAGYDQFDQVTTKIKIGEDLIGKVASDQKPQLVEDVSMLPTCHPLSIDTQSMVAVPVIYATRLIGVLLAENNSPAAFDENDQEVLTTLAGNLASIISNIRLVDQIRLQVERQRQLYEITSKIRQSTDIDTIMKTSVMEICNALNLRKASIELSPNRELVNIDNEPAKTQKGA
jgi:GAF domain-containing protein/HAMP domain-containing protein